METYVTSCGSVKKWYSHSTTSHIYQGTGVSLMNDLMCVVGCLVKKTVECVYKGSRSGSTVCSKGY